MQVRPRPPLSLERREMLTRRSNQRSLPRQTWLCDKIPAAGSKPFVAISGRDGAQIFVKSDKDTAPLLNPKRSPSMRWDA
jgi:hypothetical protein